MIIRFDSATSWFGILLALGSCSDPGSQDRINVETRDSAGVRIVESYEPLWDAGDAWVVSATPELDLTTSGLGPEHEFYRVSDLVRLSNGDVVVAVGNEIRIFSTAGTYSRTVGRAGDGPGEFQRPPLLNLLEADSILAVDFRLRRATLYGPDLALAAVIRIEVAIHDTGVAPVPEGLIVLGMPVTSYVDMPLGLSRAASPLLLVSREGMTVDTIALAAGEELFKAVSGDGVLLETPVFGRRSHLATDGFRVILGEDDSARRRPPRRPRSARRRYAGSASTSNPTTRLRAY
jgi:hypothetical protein